MNKSSFFELVRFVIVGSLATITDLSITFLLVFLFEGINSNLVTTIAFCIAFFVSFFGHKSYTFKKDGKMLSFFLLAISMLILRNIIVYLLELYIIKGLIAIIIAMFIVTFITFFISKFFVFKGEN